MPFVPDQQQQKSGRFVPDATVSPAPTITPLESPEVVKQKLAAAQQNVQEPSFIDRAALAADKVLSNVGGALQTVVPFLPDRQDAVDEIRKQVKGAASGPLSGIVQKGAQLAGNKELADKIAKTAEEGGFIGSLFQPEGLLLGAGMVGGKVADFIEKGSNWATKAARTGATVAPYAALSATSKPSDSAVSDTLEQGALGFAGGAAIRPLMSSSGWIASRVGNAIDPFLPEMAGRGSSGAERAGARLAGKVADAEKQKDEIVNLLLSAKQGQSAADATLAAQNPEFAALQRIVADTRPKISDAYRVAQDEAARAEIAKITGEPGLLERVIQRRSERAGPMRETAMKAADLMDTKGKQLADEVAARRSSMVSAMRGQPALLGSVEQKQPVARGFDVKAVFEGPQTEAAQSARRFAEGKPGWISNADRAKEWSSAADDLAAIASQRRSESAFKQAQLDSIKEYGYKPLDVDAITASIANRMKQRGEGIGIDAKVLQGVSDEIARIKAEKGRVYPEDLHEIRKKGINDVIESLNKGTPGATDKRAAVVATQTRELIDKALDDASGGMWTPYLKTFSRLSRMKDTIESGQELSRALTSASGKERKAPFETVVRRMETDVLPESGKTAMEQLYPRQRQNIENVINQFRNENRIAELQQAGTPRALGIMRATETPGGLPNNLKWEITLTNRLLRALEGQGGTKTNEALAELMFNNPQKLGQLMQQQGQPAVDAVTRAIIERQMANAAIQRR